MSLFVISTIGINLVFALVFPGLASCPGEVIAKTEAFPNSFQSKPLQPAFLLLA